jgi:hypothetical protein
MPAIGDNGRPVPVPKPKPPPKPRTVRVKAHPHVEVHVIVHPSPDAADVSARSPVQKRHDRAVSNRNIRVARKKVARKRAAAKKFPVGGGEFNPTPRQKAEASLQHKIRTNRADEAAALAPVVKVLDQTTRPLHAVAGAAREDVRTVKAKGLGNYLVHGSGSRSIRAAGRGIRNKDKYLFSDVLKEAGVKNKILRSTGGFVLDTAANPLTYVTGGTGTVAERAALRTVAKAEKIAPTARAIQASAKDARGVAMGSKEARRAAARAAGGGAASPSLAERAAERSVRTGDQTKGIRINLAGQEVPLVRKATASASKPVRYAARKATPKGVRRHAREIVADVNPNIRPAYASPYASRKAIMATRTARAKSSHGRHIAQEQAIGLHKSVSESERVQIIDAIEGQNIQALSPRLQRIAKRHVKDQLRFANRMRKRSGIKGGERANYIPHYLTPEGERIAEVEKAGSAGSVGRKVVRPASSRARKRKGTLAELRASHPGQYVEDLPAVVGRRMEEGHTAVARAEFNRAIAETGHTLKKGQFRAPGEGESVYHIVGSDIRKVATRDAAKALRPLKRTEVPVLDAAGDVVRDANGKRVTKIKYTRGSKQGGRFVILNDEIVKRALEGANPELRGAGVVHALDRTTAGFKRIAIATPGFHIRNIIGDMSNAYIGQAGHRIPGNTVRAGRVLKAYGRQERALRSLTPAQVGQATLKTGRYGRITYDEAAKQLRDHGAFRSGYIARELPELAASGKASGKVLQFKTKRFPQSVKRAVLGREDLPRLVTAMQMLRDGASWEEAASRVADLHFDYQHLTDFERQVMRRAMPFYTWNARNIPLQARTLVGKPGKIANFQTIREEAASASNPGQVDPQTRELYRQLERAGVKLPGGYERYMAQYEQRNAGVPISWKGHKFTVSAGLPLQDLNETPGVAGIREYGDKAMSLVNPIVKNPTELGFNYSFFFRDQIERDESPLVSAPAYVAGFSASDKKRFRIAKIRDKRTGKMVWGWPGKVDYVAHMVPGIPNYAQQFATPGKDRRGKGTAGRVLQFSGIRSIPIDPVKNAVDLAYERQRIIRKRLSELHQQGVGKDNPSAEWRRLNDQLKITSQIAYQGKAQQDYKVLPPQGGPSKRVYRRPKVTLGSGTSSSHVRLNSERTAGGASVKLN